MLLVEKERLKEQLFDSNVVITSLEEDKEAVTEMMTEFNIVGLNYVFLAKGKEIVKDFWYWRACEESLKRASCLIIVMSRAFFAEENAERREAFWYEAGLMEARGQSVIPYFCDIPRGEWDGFISKTPIRQKQATDSVDELINQIELTRAFKKSFFKDRKVALYGNSRTYYTKLTVLFNIKKEVLDGILARLKLLEDDEVQTRSDILNILHREINFGARIYRFGKECFIKHPYYSAYLPEAEILDIDCNATNADNRFNMLSQNINSASCAVKVDFILPNHEVLGVSVKPYMEISKNSVIRKADLINLLKSECGDEIFNEKLDVKEASTPRTDRVYFNFYFDDDTLIIDCDNPDFGKSCNYIYAK